MIKKYLQIIIMLMIAVSASAQIPEIPKSMLSPNAASLGEYGEVPVSPFTGIPQIEIPLYEIKVGDFKMPITMSYHAGGVRPDQHPGWTGLGWTLNAGGCISRIVNDLPDENDIPKNGFNKYGYYFRREILNNNNWNSYNQLLHMAEFGQWTFDTEPDEFSFNFLGYSGKFYLDEKGNWKVKCDKNIKVTFNNESITPNVDLSSANNNYGIPYSFKTFTLTTDDGTQYIFGNDVDAIEYFVDIFTQMSERFVANTWHLTKIILPNSSTINFSYERKDYICQLYSSSYLTLSYKTRSISGWSILKPACSTGGIVSSLNLRSNNTNGQLIYPTYLKLITTPTSRVEFYMSESNELKYDYRPLFNLQENAYRAVYPYENFDGFMPILMKNAKYTTNPNNLNYPDCLEGMRWYKLDYMRVKDSVQNYVKSFSFSYNNNDTERLFLKKISEFSDIATTSGRKYQFEYHSPNLLPPYLANQTDHWGFYNGIQIPNAQIQLTDYTNYKEPAFNAGLYGTLNKITYPTGGYTKFIFEANSYRKELENNRTECSYSNEDKPAGGLRIKKIINSTTGSSYDEYVFKEYFYVTDYFRGKTYSSGEIGTRPLYHYYDYRITPFEDNSLEVSMDIFSSQSVLPASTNSCGVHVGYSEVIEKNSDNSFSRFFYTNFDDGHYDSPFDATIQPSHSRYEPYSLREQERGVLKMKEEYNSNSVLQRKLRVTYENDDNSSNNYIRTVKVKVAQACKGSGIKYAEGTAYRIYTYVPRKIKEIDCIYGSNSDSLKTISTISYNNHKLVSHISKTVNNDEVQHTYFKYAADYDNGVPKLMKDKHILSPVVEIRRSLSDAYNNTFEIDKISYNYSTTYTPTLFRPISVSKSVNGSNNEIIETYRYDTRGNIIYHERNLTDRTVYIWGYNYQYLVAEIKNATLEQVTTTIGSIDALSKKLTPTASDFTSLNALRTVLPNSQVRTFEYKLMTGVSIITNPNGTKVYYEYDALTRLIQTKDNNGNILEQYKYNYKKN